MAQIWHSKKALKACGCGSLRGSFFNFPLEGYRIFPPEKNHRNQVKELNWKGNA